jgi:hypothetical protein
MSNISRIPTWASVRITESGHEAITELETCTCGDLVFEGLLLSCKICRTVWGSARDHVEEFITREKRGDW